MRRTRTSLQVRDRVLGMLEEARDISSAPSNYWEAELAGFDYILDASPLVIRHLRDHCYHFTGIRSFEYQGPPRASASGVRQEVARPARARRI